jgi:hypothetical protein
MHHTFKVFYRGDMVSKILGSRMNEVKERLRQYGFVVSKTDLFGQSSKPATAQSSANFKPKPAKVLLRRFEGAMKAALLRNIQALLRDIKAPLRRYDGAMKTLRLHMKTLGAMKALSLHQGAMMAL